MCKKTFHTLSFKQMKLARFLFPTPCNRKSLKTLKQNNNNNSLSDRNVSTTRGNNGGAKSHIKGLSI